MKRIYVVLMAVVMLSQGCNHNSDATASNPNNNNQQTDSNSVSDAEYDTIAALHIPHIPIAGDFQQFWLQNKGGVYNLNVITYAKDGDPTASIMVNSNIKKRTVRIGGTGLLINNGSNTPLATAKVVLVIPDQVASVKGMLSGTSMVDSSKGVFSISQIVSVSPNPDGKGGVVFGVADVTSAFPLAVSKAK